jgi:hypothetical protein
MTLPQETRDKIWQDAKAYARLHRKSISGTYAQNYVAGATEWAGKATGLVDALEKIIEMNRQNALDQYGDADKAESWGCVVVAREGLQKYKEVVK